MTLHADAFRGRNGVPGLPCKLASVLEQLPDADREVLRGAIDDPDVQHARIERVLRDELDIWVPQIAVGRHRRRQCRCFA